MADLLGSTTGPQVRVVVNVAEDLPPAQADPNQLKMALLNLGVNARDAMPDGWYLALQRDARKRRTAPRRWWHGMVPVSAASATYGTGRMGRTKHPA